MQWKFIEKGSSNLMILLPGWGFSWQVFFKPNTFVEQDFDFAVPLIPISKKTSHHLIELLNSPKAQNRPVTILGWSLGALPVLDIFPQYKHKISQVILAAVRKGFTQEEIESQASMITHGPQKGLIHFYRRCFIGQQEDFKWFKQNIMPICLNSFTTSELLEGLQYLLTPIKTDMLNDEKIKLVYGVKDIIVPKTHRLNVQADRLTLLPNIGHLPFLSPEFISVIH